MWNTTEPPKDRPIVAVGGIMIEDEMSTTKIPFCQLIWWSEEHKDWMLGAPSEPTHLRRSESEEVIIHYWAEMPSDNDQHVSKAWSDLLEAAKQVDNYFYLRVREYAANNEEEELHLALAGAIKQVKALDKPSPTP